VNGWLGVDDAWRIIDASLAGGDAPDEGHHPGTWR
jgi:hypothetical protein